MGRVEDEENARLSRVMAGDHSDDDAPEREEAAATPEGDGGSARCS